MPLCILDSHILYVILKESAQNELERQIDSFFIALIYYMLYLHRGKKLLYIFT